AYVAAARAVRPLDEVTRAARRAALARGGPAFAQALRERRGEGRLAVIAEVKRTSPALGRLSEIEDPARLAKGYRGGGASAISVLVEPRHWGGSLEDLRAVEGAVRPVPVLAKDVVVDEYQIAEAGAAGAYAILLIAEIFETADLMRLAGFAGDLGMDA